MDMQTSVTNVTMTCLSPMRRSPRSHSQLSLDLKHGHFMCPHRPTWRERGRTTGNKGKQDCITGLCYDTMPSPGDACDYSVMGWAIVQIQ